MGDLSEAGRLEAVARGPYQERDYGRVVELLDRAPRDTVTAAPLLAFWLADSMRRVGRGAAALQLLAESAAAFARHGNDALNRQRLNLDGMLRFEQGAVAQAETSWRTLLADASTARDDDFVARANNNLGVVCTLHERWEEAIACYERASAAYRLIGRRRGLAQSHQNLGITYRELDFAREADRHFLQAIRYAAADGSEDEIARAEQERALLIYLSRRDAPLARATAERALQRFDAIGDRGGTADSLRVLGMIALGEGDLVRATSVLESALQRARETHLTIVEAETLEALGSAAERAGDDARSATLRADAEKLFARTGAIAWGARTRARMTQLGTAPAAHIAGADAPA